MHIKLLNALNTFEKDLITFMPYAEAIKEKAESLSEIFEEAENNKHLFTEEQIRECDEVGARVDDMCDKISDMF